MKRSGERKGFLFVVTVFLILTYILLSISVWVRGIESSERMYSELYRESNVELSVEQITPGKVDNVSHDIMMRSMGRLNDLSASSPVLEGDGGELSNIEAAMGELLLNGSASSAYFESGSGLAMEGSSMNSWVQNLNTSLLAIGMYVDDFELYNFHMSQRDIDIVNYSFDMRLSMRDIGGDTSVARNYHIENEVSISGYIDPALLRASAAATSGSQEIRRAFFFNKEEYRNAGDGIEIRDVSSLGMVPVGISGGQGWFYGYLAHADDAESVPADELGRYVLVGTYEELRAADPRQAFGAYIVTSAPADGETCGEHTGQRDTFNPVRYAAPSCEASIDFEAGSYTAKPFIEAEGFEFDGISSLDCPGSEYSTSAPVRKCALILAANPVMDVAEDPELKLERAGAGIFAVETLRDFVMCGYYTHNGAAPSYLQRLLNNSYGRSDALYGIETFVIGEYSNSDAYGDNGRLDRELFGSTDGIAVRGMPGCKQYEHCQDDPSTGVFRTTEGSVRTYGAEDIYCEEAEGCEE